MTEELSLMVTAVSLGFLHTIMGPDHYVPFVAMAHANQWSTRKSIAVTIACGTAHVASSILIGLTGLLLGVLVLSLQSIESMEAARGETAAWMLIALGAGYLIFGLLRAHGKRPLGMIVHHHHDRVSKQRPPELHPANNETLALPPESHPSLEPSEQQASERQAWTPWMLFLVFAFGPCEVLIPMLMYPAAKANWTAVLGVVLAFGAATLITMTGAVLIMRLIMRLGLRAVPLPDMHRYSHALAGAAVLICGLAVKFGL